MVIKESFEDPFEYLIRVNCECTSSPINDVDSYDYEYKELFESIVSQLVLSDSFDRLKYNLVDHGVSDFYNPFSNDDRNYIGEISLSFEERVGKTQLRAVIIEYFKNHPTEFTYIGEHLDTEITISVDSNIEDEDILEV